jgi:short-subunit dehydrogenase
MARQAVSALITGASAGIGRTYAEHLARTGHDLILVARRADVLGELATKLGEAHGVNVEVLAADLISDEGVARVTNRIENGTPIDLVINNAGFAVRGKVAELDPDALDQMLRLNVNALAKLSHTAMKRMVAEGRGSIINVSSATSFILFPTNAGYGASKNFVMAFTRHMQMEAEGTGVRVQLLVPGVIATEFHTIAGGDVNSFPPSMVMKVDDLVVASLRALEMNEQVCIPSLPDITDWEKYLAAEAAVASDVSRDHIAKRYH